MLSIDSSGKTAAVAVTEDGQLIAQSFTDSGLTHSQTLLPLADSVLRLANTDISDIDEFALTVGPGSFTGLRIGAALVMGLAGQRPCRPVSTLEALSYNLADDSCVILPVMDARRQQVYTAVFQSDGKSIKRLEADAALPMEAVLERARDYAKNNRVCILGDGAYLFERAADIPGVFFPQGKLMFTQGMGVARAAENAPAVKRSEIRLEYLRMSQAERELKEKQK